MNPNFLVKITQYCYAEKLIYARTIAHLAQQ